MPFRNTIDEIRRRAGLAPVDYKKEVNEAQNRGTGEATIYLADDEDMMQMEDPTPVRLAVEYDVEPTEYDGPHVFYQGGVNVTGAKVYETFQFMGKTVQHGQPFPEELLRYVVRSNGDTIHQSGQDPWNNFVDHLSQEMAEGGDVQVPAQHYPDSRGQ